MTEVTILVGTTKGAFLIEGGAARSGWRVRGPYCDGWPINHVVADRESGMIWAGGGGDWNGAGVWRSADGGESWELTHDHVDALAELEVPAPQDPQRIQVWLQTGDETLDYKRAQTFYRACALRIEAGGDHSFQGFAEKMPTLLSIAGFAPELLRAIDPSTLE